MVNNHLAVEYYTKDNGICPYQKFIVTVDKKMREKIEREIDLLQQYGIDFDHVHIKYFRQGIYKLRVNQGNSTTRIFFIIENNVIYILHGFTKVTQKTPEGEKARIVRYKNDVLKRLDKVNRFLSRGANK